MRDYLEQIDAAATSAYYLALVGALTVPDICGALEAPNGRATEAKYVAWFNRWVGPAYARGEKSFTGIDCYLYRCAMLHQARARPTRERPPRGSFERVLFVEPGHDPEVHDVIIAGALVIEVPTFVRDVTAAARRWLEEVEGTEPFERNDELAFRRYPYGLEPYIVGAPVIG